MKKIQVTFCIVLAIVLSCFSGCESTARIPMNIAYLNTAGEIVTEMHEFPGNEAQSTCARRIINAMNAPKQLGSNALSEILEVLEFNIEGNSITLYVELRGTSVGFSVLSAVMTYSFTEIPGIEYIRLMVKEEEHFSETTGFLAKHDFIIDYDALDYNQLFVNVYYTNVYGRSLVAETLRIAYEDSETFARDVLSELMNGPNERGLYKLIPDELFIHYVSVLDEVCYINFGGGGSKMQSAPANEGELLVYSIVNTLCELRDISSVRFLHEGQSIETFYGIDVREPLIYDRSLIEIT